jgi:arylsulfatase A-like enzyme
MNGTHRPDGVLVATEGLTLPVERRGSASIVDLAPTLLAAMGLAWDGRLDGESLAAPRAYSPEEEAEVAARLRALGYLE